MRYSVAISAGSSSCGQAALAQVPFYILITKSGLDAYTTANYSYTQAPLQTSYGRFFALSNFNRIALPSYPGFNPDAVTDGSSWDRMSRYDLDGLLEGYVLWFTDVMPQGCKVRTNTFEGSFVRQNGRFELVLANEHQAGFRISCPGGDMSFKFQ